MKPTKIIKCIECDLAPKGTLEYDIKLYHLECPKCDKKVKANSGKMCAFRWRQKNKQQLAQPEQHKGEE